MWCASPRDLSALLLVDGPPDALDVQDLVGVDPDPVRVAAFLRPIELCPLVGLQRLDDRVRATVNDERLVIDDQ